MTPIEDIIVEEAAALAGVSVDTFTQEALGARPRPFVRQCAMALLREAGCTQEAAALRLGRMSYRSTAFAVKAVAHARASQPARAALYDRLVARIHHRTGKP